MKRPLVLLVATLFIACTSGETVTGVTDSTVAAQVVNVVDGDTLDVLLDGTEYRIRYIGIDTPETVHPTRGEEPYGREASARNRELVEGATVFLERDVSETDRFDRLLRYVWLEDGTMVNEALVAEGYAQVSTFPPDVKYVERFLAAQKAARAAGRGLGRWFQLPLLVAVTLPTPTYASHHLRRTWTAARSAIPTSQFSRRTRTGSMVIGMELGVIGRNGGV